MSFFIREEEVRQAIRLRLLALVLALALTWYAMNPAPSPVRRIKQKEGQPDEERREASPSVLIRHDWHMRESDVTELVIESAVENIDDLEWPELIETR